MKYSKAIGLTRRGIFEFGKFFACSTIMAVILEVMAQKKALFTAVNLVTITFSFSGKSQVQFHWR